MGFLQIFTALALISTDCSRDIEKIQEMHSAQLRGYMHDHTKATWYRGAAEELEELLFIAHRADQDLILEAQRLLGIYYALDGNLNSAEYNLMIALRLDPSVAGDSAQLYMYWAKRLALANRNLARSHLHSVISISDRYALTFDEGEMRSQLFKLREEAERILEEWDSHDGKIKAALEWDNPQRLARLLWHRNRNIQRELGLVALEKFLKTRDLEDLEKALQCLREAGDDRLSIVSDPIRDKRSRLYQTLRQLEIETESRTKVYLSAEVTKYLEEVLIP